MIELRDSGGFGNGSYKLHWRIRGNETVGSTFYNFPDEDHPGTLCVASQIGCNVGCQFCHAHHRDKVSNLSPQEMVAQVESSIAFLRNDAGRRDINALQVAFMGFGEPMHNLDNVIEAKRRLDRHEYGIDLMFNISTSGWVPGIKVLEERDPSFRLCVSLHASDDQTRNQIIPAENTYPLEQLVDAAESYYEASGKKVLANYLLIDGMNDTRRDAMRLAELLRPDAFRVNIPHLVNPPVDYLENASEEMFEEFKGWVSDEGLDAKVY